MATRRSQRGLSHHVAVALAPCSLLSGWLATQVGQDDARVLTARFAVLEAVAAYISRSS